MEAKKGANERRNGGIKARVEAVKGRYGDEGVPGADCGGGGMRECGGGGGLEVR